MVLAIILGFVFGFALGLIPLIKARFRIKDAVRQVLIAEGLSIVVMETAEVLVEVYTPGVMQAGLSSWLFWFGMTLAFRRKIARNLGFSVETILKALQCFPCAQRRGSGRRWKCPCG